jgi:hypothetical protein
MRNKKELQFEIEMIIREMSQCVIAQSDLDNRLSRLDKRRAFLEKELETLNASQE